MLFVFITISSASASDVNITDSYSTSLVDDTTDVSVKMENIADSSESSVLIDSNNDSSKVSLSSEEVLKSENSSTLSTNAENESLRNSDLNTTISTQLTSPTTSIYYKGAFTITLSGVNGTVLSGKTVNFVINGVKYSSITNTNGIASVSLSLNPAKYSAVAYFDGDDTYEAVNLSSTLTILSTIYSKDITKYYKGSTVYSATFYNSDGSLLKNTDVKITVNGKTYTKKTNSKGFASLSINLKPGTYKVVATDPKTGFKLTTTFKILSTITASSISKVYADAKKFTAKFLKSTGKALTNQKVKFKINGKTYVKKTNSKGYASLSLKSLKKGTYKIISYNKDGLTKTNTIKVYRTASTKLTSNDYTFLKSDSKTIKVRLLNSLGYAPSKGKIVKITINGKTYSKKTNADGYASLKLPTLKNGIYTVKYKFSGNNYYKSSSTSGKVSVIPSKTPTLTVKSTTIFNKGSSNPFILSATSGSVPLIKKTITFELNNKKYTKTTNNNGQVSLSINVDVGNYTLSYSIAKDSKINSKSGSVKIVVKQKETGNNVYWLFGGDMKNVNLNSLAQNGTTDILLNFKAYELYGKDGLESWISNANKVGINVHMWTQVFYTNATGWVNPVVNNVENTAFFTTKLAEIKKYAALKGISGIHLDYIRYPGTAMNTDGGTQAITSFIKQAVAAVNSVNPTLIVSAALMPETSSIEKYYGQDYASISQYVDVVVPMIYKYNYGQTTSWITKTTKWFVDNSKGAKVWAGLQTYKSDGSVSKLSASELSADINAALKGGADGISLFRYGIATPINLNSLSSYLSSDNTISIENIVTSAGNLKSYIENNNKLPNTVTTGGYTFTLPEFLYLMSKAIAQIGESDYSDISIISGIQAPSSPSGDSISSKNLEKDEYLNLSKNIVNFILTNLKAPNYATSTVGKIIYSEIVDSASRILAYYATNNRLPNYVTINYASSSSSYSVTGSGLTETNKITDLSAYLASSKNCEVGNSKIKSIVNSLTNGLTTDNAKATAIFNYVRDTLSYSFYYNTKYGAVGTLTAKKGNCVDHTHLLVAMFRTAGLAARYVHGTCKFSSGSTYGHVWCQVLINGMWVVCDATSSKNTLGKITNWNTNSFTLKGIYSSLSF